MRAGVDPNATREFYPSLQPYFKFYEFIVQVITVIHRFSITTKHYLSNCYSILWLVQRITTDINLHQFEYQKRVISV